MRIKLALILAMGLFSNLFGQSEKKDSSSSASQELRLEYSVMKNITLVKLKKYENQKRYKQVEDGIYIDLQNPRGFNFNVYLQVKS